MDYFSIFIQMLQAKSLTDNTIRSHKTYIKPHFPFLAFHGTSPEDASWQDMRDYLSWFKLERCLCGKTINMIVSYLEDDPFLLFWTSP